MPVFGTVAPLEGADAFFKLLAFVNDPQAVAARVKELTDLQAQVNAAIAVVGTLEDVEALAAGAKKDRDRAAEQLTRARDEATNIVRAAYAGRDAAVAATATLTAEAKATRDALTSERAAYELDLATRETALRAHESEARTAWDDARKAKAEGEAFRTEWSEKMDRFRAAVAGS